MGVIRGSLNSLCANVTDAHTAIAKAANHTANDTTFESAINLTTTTVRSPPVFIAVKDGSSANASFICTATGTRTMSEQSSLDALFYIVVVLLFYAFSIVVLMVKYIRRENREAYLRQYFEEFVSRDKFETARIRNQLHVLHMKHVISAHKNPDVRAHLTQQRQTSSEQRVLLDSIPEMTCEEDTEDELGFVQDEDSENETVCVLECSEDDTAYNHEDYSEDDLACNLDYSEDDTVCTQFYSEDETASVPEHLLPRRETPV